MARARTERDTPAARPCGDDGSRAMRKFTGLAIAAVVAAAGATVRAQDEKPKDSVLEDLIKKQLEQQHQEQEQAQKDDAKYGAETAEQRLARARLLADSEHDYEK